MAHKLILFLTETGLHAWQARGRDIQPLGDFSLDDAGRDAFCSLVQKNRDDFYYLLTDLVEEEFKLDLVPHVGRSDQAKLIARRLEQLYRGTPYRAYLPQGRETDGRRQDRVLFAALANPGLIDVWVKLLDECEARLAGIYSVALLLDLLASKLLPQGGNYLLVTRQADDALRQTYLTSQGLRFSRLTSVGAANAEQQAETIVSESMRARQFLASTRGIGREEQMRVLVVTTAHDLPTLEAHCQPSELIGYQFVTLIGIAQRLGIALGDETDRIEQLLLRVLAGKAPANQYAPAEQRKYYRTWQLRLSLDIAAASTLSLGAIAAATLVWQGMRLQSDIKATQQQIAAAEATYQANALTAAQGEVTPEAMKNAVLAHREVVQGWPTLNADFDRLSLALDAMPRLQIDKINWGVRDRADWAKESVEALAAAVPAADGSIAPAQRFVVMIIEGRIQPFNNEWRESLALLEQFGERLKVRPDYQITPLQRPFEPKPNVVLKLDSTVDAKESGSPFALRVAYPLGAATP